MARVPVKAQTPRETEIFELRGDLNEIFRQVGEIGGGLGTIGQAGSLGFLEAPAEEWREMADDIERQISKLKGLVEQIRGGANILGNGD